MCDSQSRKPVIGITGPIGSGKSLAASILRDLGSAVIDSDEQARQVLSEPAGIEFVRRHLGPECITAEGGIDRKAVADVVFSDVGLKKLLEGFIYPEIASRRAALLQQYQADTAIRAIVLESALLIEIGLKHQCDRVILVYADLEIRQARVVETRSWNREELIRREKFFWPVYLKCSIADDIVYNNFTADACRRQIEEIFSQTISSVTC